MATLLAPYNNAMRLGQGFNSYTQQICIDNAVSPVAAIAEKQTPPPKPEDADTAMDAQNNKRHGVSQIVSYSSRFVDKLSDMTDAMNISASLSIKTSTIGGSASGSFIDSDKFKQSDLNFFMQVKVTNQSHVDKDYTKFQKIPKVAATRFTDVYGDTFISGWEEGGELNALISVKVLDKSKTFDVKAELEASLGTPALSGEVKGKVAIGNSSINTNTETTISVNWSGGGQIKETDVLWDINSLSLAAANFPDFVAETPQKTYAILTKYTALRTFQEEMGSFQPLDYENAGIYTSALLDAYMDYKSIWKQIQLTNIEVEAKRSTLERAKLPQEMIDAASALVQSAIAATELHTVQNSSIADSTSSSDPKVIVETEATEREDAKAQLSSKPKVPKPLKPHVLSLEPYAPSIMGLDKARRDCRLEMVKIVHEVDLVTCNPDVALDPGRDALYLSPIYFKQLLPVATVVPPEIKPAPVAALVGPSDTADATKPSSSPDKPSTESNTGTTGTSKPIAEPVASNNPPELFMGNKRLLNVPEVQQSVEKHKAKAATYRMSDWLGNSVLGSDDQYFNDLDTLNNLHQPKEIVVWTEGNGITGVKIVYKNGASLSHGPCAGNGTNWMFNDDRITLVRLARSSVTGTDAISQIAVASSKGDIWDGNGLRQNSLPDWQGFIAPPGPNWGLRGFYGSHGRSNCRALVNLGVIWGKDEAPPAAPIPEIVYPPVCKVYHTLPTRIQQSLTSANLSVAAGTNYRMTDFAGNKTSVEGGDVFNPIGRINSAWKLSKIELLQHGQVCICGLSLTYRNGEKVHLGASGGPTPAYTVDLGSDKKIVGVTVLASADPSYLIGGMKFIVANAAMDEYQTLSFATPDSSRMKLIATRERAPADSDWSLGSFYAQCNSPTTYIIGRIGMIWVRD